MTKYSIILATDEEFGIGKNNDLPWRNKDDMRWFRKNTLNKAVVMGRNTWESLGKKPLPNRHNIIVTSREPEDESIVSYVSDITEIKDMGLDEVVFIGGRMIWTDAINLFNIEYGLITTIYGTHDCDTFFDYRTYFKKYEVQGFGEDCYFKLGRI